MLAFFMPGNPFFHMKVNCVMEKCFLPKVSQSQREAACGAHLCRFVTGPSLRGIPKGSCEIFLQKSIFPYESESLYKEKVRDAFVNDG